MPSVTFAPPDDPSLAESGVSIIVVTYKNAAHIGGCVAAVRRALPAVPTELIIVDNASGDETAAAAKDAAPDALIIEHHRNGGFADGCRVGAAQAGGRWLLFLNPDAVPAPGSVDALLDCARRHPAAGIVGGKCVRPDGSADPRSWWGRPSLWSVFCFALLLSSVFPGSRRFDPESPLPWSDDPDEERLVPIVTGAFMLVDRYLWKRLGGFDTAFFMYGEDADLCLRAAAAGHRPMVTARAEFQHSGGASSSSPRKLRLLFTGKVTLLNRHLPRGRRALAVRLLLLGVLLRAVAGRVLTARPERQGRPTTAAADWRTLWSTRRDWRKGW
jgi:N-acetylglucosaminyl-diphospho-decaprenol L-rhamnosyltransferase